MPDCETSTRWELNSLTIGDRRMARLVPRGLRSCVWQTVPAVTVWLHAGREIRGAGWEQSGALNGVALQSTAANGAQRHTPDLRSCVFAGQRRCSVLLHTECSAVLRSSRRSSMSPGRRVCAGQGGKESPDGLALHVGADWVQVGEVVTASECSPRPEKGRRADLRRCGRADRRDLPENTEEVKLRCSPLGWCR